VKEAGRNWSGLYQQLREAPGVCRIVKCDRGNSPPVQPRKDVNPPEGEGRRAWTEGRDSVVGGGVPPAEWKSRAGCCLRPAHDRQTTTLEEAIATLVSIAVSSVRKRAIAACGPEIAEKAGARSMPSTAANEAGVLVECGAHQTITEACPRRRWGSMVAARHGQRWPGRSQGSLLGLVSSPC